MFQFSAFANTAEGECALFASTSHKIIIYIVAHEISIFATKSRIE